MNNGISDIFPVINSYTDALLDMFPLPQLGENCEQTSNIKHLNLKTR